jgi:hypothetical protein
VHNVLLLTIVTCDWSSTLSKTSSGSSSASVARSIPSRRIILWCLIILHGIVLGMCRFLVWLHFIVGLFEILYCCCAMLYGAGASLNCGVSFPVIISTYTLYASDVLSCISSIVMEYLSSWPTNLQKLQYELFGIVWYFYIIVQ